MPSTAKDVVPGVGSVETTAKVQQLPKTGGPGGHLAQLAEDLLVVEPVVKDLCLDAGLELGLVDHGEDV
jgi:hypothetical protein